MCLAASPPFSFSSSSGEPGPAPHHDNSSAPSAVTPSVPGSRIPSLLATGAGCNATPILDHPGSFPIGGASLRLSQLLPRPHIGRVSPSLISRCRRVFWACPVNPVASPLLAVSAVRSPAYLPEATQAARTGAGANQLDVAVLNGRQKKWLAQTGLPSSHHHRRRKLATVAAFASHHSPLTTIDGTHSLTTQPQAPGCFPTHFFHHHPPSPTPSALSHSSSSSLILLLCRRRFPVPRVDRLFADFFFCFGFGIPRHAGTTASSRIFFGFLVSLETRSALFGVVGPLPPPCRETNNGRRRPRRSRRRRDRMSTSSLAMASTGKSLHPTSADTWATTLSFVPGHTRYETLVPPLLSWAPSQTPCPHVNTICSRFFPLHSHQMAVSRRATSSRHIAT